MADPRPGDGNAAKLKRYWLAGEGRRKWTTWTELYNHLKKYLGAARAKRVASAWYHEGTGMWSGSDRNRVAHGKPPRGNRVGPG